MVYPVFLEENVMAFARILRSEGMRAGPREAGDALTALHRLEITDRGDFFHTLRTLFAGSPGKSSVSTTCSKDTSVADCWMGAGERIRELMIATGCGLPYPGSA